MNEKTIRLLRMQKTDNHYEIASPDTITVTEFIRQFLKDNPIFTGEININNTGNIIFIDGECKVETATPSTMQEIFHHADVNGNLLRQTVSVTTKECNDTKTGKYGLKKLSTMIYTGKINPATLGKDCQKNNLDLGSIIRYMMKEHTETHSM